MVKIVYTDSDRPTLYIPINNMWFNQYHSTKSMWNDGRIIANDNNME